MISSLYQYGGALLLDMVSLIGGMMGTRVGTRVLHRATAATQ